jgi:hypothetical protein
MRALSDIFCKRATSPKIIFRFWLPTRVCNITSPLLLKDRGINLHFTSFNERKSWLPNNLPMKSHDAILYFSTLPTLQAVQQYYLCVQWSGFWTWLRTGCVLNFWPITYMYRFYTPSQSSPPHTRTSPYTNAIYEHALEQIELWYLL